MPSVNSKKSDRPFDVVLYGATGFVGRQTVAYFAQSPAVVASNLRWALAGRNAAKLEQVKQACPGAQSAGVVVAAADDVKALNALAKSCRVVLSTAGPFSLYGSELVAACVRHGTHYVDITGETPWAANMIAQHHEAALKSGTRIIPFCGFDSVPSDLGTWMMVQAMQQRFSKPCSSVKAAFSLTGGVNGGTLASMFNIIGSENANAVAELFLLNPGKPKNRDTPRATLTANADPVAPHHDPRLKAWLMPFFMSVINTRVVRRSAAMLGDAAGYPPEFHYQEYLRVGSGLVAGAAAATISTGMAVSQLALKVNSVRKLAAALAPKPGSGPSEARMDGGSFRCELIATSADGDVLRGRVADRGDPGNRATTKMVCEAALCLALEQAELPGGPTYGGVLTPAAGLGDVLLGRLRAAGMTWVVD